MIKTTKSPNRRGFTIVELIVSIAVIVILALIVTVSYQKLTEQAAIVSLKSELSDTSDSVKMYVSKLKKTNYPDSLEDAGQKSSTENTSFQYSSTGDTFYCITATSNNHDIPAFYISSQTNKIAEGTCPSHESNAD